MPEPFDLEAAVSAWRARLAAGRTLRRSELEELEAHLFDVVDERTAAGLCEREAFEAALWQLGHTSLLEATFRAAHEAERQARPPWQHPVWVPLMLKSYLTVALRALRRQPGYAFINVFGLSLGIACCVLLFLYVRDELTFDRFHERAGRIYRVYRVGYNPDGSVAHTSTNLPMPLGPAMAADFPEVEAYVRFWDGRHFVQRAGREASQEEILFADPTLFEVFTFPLRGSRPADALAGPASVVLTEKAARRFFGDEDAVGQRLAIRLKDRFEDFTVTAVAEEPPGNSTIHFDIVLPFARVQDLDEWFRQSAEAWNSSAYFTFVQLRDPSAAAKIAALLPDFRRKYYPGEAERLRAEGQWAGDGDPAGFKLQPLPAIHLDPTVAAGMTPPSDPVYSYVLSGIALAVLLIACINFMTLSIGRSARRAKEVGIRKAVGAHRRQLMAQFWGEAVVLSGLALVLGLVLALLFLPTFNALAGKSLRLDAATGGLTVLVLAGLMLFTGLVAGAYPALVLSGFNPVDTLRNRYRLGGSNTFTRTVVVVQFALSVFLVSSTFVMLDQLHYVRSKHLGFDKEQVVAIQTNGVDGQQALDRFRAILKDRPEVVGLGAANSAFTYGQRSNGWMYQGEQKDVVVYSVSPSFAGLMGMELAAGRDFDPRLSTDSARAALVNEALVRDFGWADPIGQPLTGFTGSPETDPVVVGVVKDFHYSSLHEPVAPLMLTLRRYGANFEALLVRIRPGDVSGTVGLLQATWKQVAPDVPFQYSFVDDDLDRQYRADAQWSRIVAYAAAFAVVIACLGLFGLAALSVAGRTKEIGIRKVLGASVPRLARLLSREFALLVGAAVVLAMPAAYLAMGRWLEGFAYRVDLSWWLFAAAGGGALLVALAAVSYQTIRAALADPVRSLRYE